MKTKYLAVSTAGGVKHPCNLVNTAKTVYHIQFAQ